MFNEIFLYIKDITIFLLIIVLWRSIRQIRKLNEIIKKEKRQRSLPLMTLKVHNEEDFGMFLVNDSSVEARSITIDDLDVVVDYGFKKHVVLKFDPLNIIRPREQVKLTYRVFDDNFDTTTCDAHNILNHLHDSPIEMRLRYENLEKTVFTSTITPNEKGNYYVKEVSIVG